MKTLLSCLLTGVLLLSFPLAASADETPVESETPDIESASKVVIVASEDDLPEGYVVDSDFSYSFELKADTEWMLNLTDILSKYAGDEYIYFFVEKDAPEGYTPYYIVEGEEISGGTIIVIKNIREGSPPVYELPKTGARGVEQYTVAGSAILLTCAAYILILNYKRKKELESIL